MKIELANKDSSKERMFDCIRYNTCTQFDNFKSFEMLKIKEFIATLVYEDEDQSSDEED